MMSSRGVLLGTAMLGGTAALVVLAMKTSHTLAASVLLALLPFIVISALSIVEAVDAVKTPPQQQRSVLRISRAMYEQLDPEVLQLFLTERDFTSRDYERLMQLEAFNEQKKSEGMSQSDIRCLPLVRVTEAMLRASKHPNCSVCLLGMELADDVRMLPCFHYFHPNCIDPWLREKAQCPICKCPVVG